MAWGKITQFFRVFSRDRVPDMDLWERENFTRNLDGWEYQAMRCYYTPGDRTPGNHP